MLHLANRLSMPAAYAVYFNLSMQIEFEPGHAVNDTTRKVLLAFVADRINQETGESRTPSALLEHGREMFAALSTKAMGQWE